MSLKFPISLAGKRGANSINLSHVSGYTGGNLSTGVPYTFSNCDLGDPAPNRQIVVCITARAFGSFGSWSVTVGGQSCVLDLGAPVIYGENFAMVYVARATVPDGATGDVVISVAGSSINTQGLVISIYRLEADSLIVRDTDIREYSSPQSGTKTLTVDVITGGGLIAFGTRRGGLGPTWISGVTQDYTGYAGRVSIWTGHTNMPSDDPAYNATTDLGANTFGPALALLSYEPN